ncbi:MAG: hypothetical protein SGARI_007978, partial [Bacillariaceae sp.]
MSVQHSCDWGPDGKPGLELDRAANHSAECVPSPAGETVKASNGTWSPIGCSRAIIQEKSGILALMETCLRKLSGMPALAR